MRLTALLSTGLFLVARPGAADAACPLELSVYSNAGSAAAVEFTTGERSATVTNRFRMLAGGFVLDGIVQWSEGIERPYGMVTHECPAGDVTGAEIAACTVWQGVIYGSDLAGNIGLLPAEGEPAPDRLLFPDLGPSLADALGGDDSAFAGASFDVLALQGCQE